MDPVDDPLNYKLGIFYFNKNDFRTIVPKTSRVMGMTLNFAKWGSYALLIVVIGVLILSSVLPDKF